MQILNGELVRSELTKNAKGGSELMAERLHAFLPQSLLKDFQIVLSRGVELDESKVRIFWAHDLPGDPGANCLLNEGWKSYHKIVFVSYWQRDKFIQHYRIPYSKTTVLRNAIIPFTEQQLAIKDFTGDVVRFIYHTTPHRGLDILVGVFDAISKLPQWKNKIHLDVYSSFKVYGWEQNDKPYEQLFNFIKQHDHMTYHGAVSNDEVRKALIRSHVFAYPCTHPETSCIALIEAMAAGCECIHSDFGALPETAADLTNMYNFHENPEQHANRLYYSIVNTLPVLNRLRERSNIAQGYINSYYDMPSIRSAQWKMLLQGLLNETKDRSLPKNSDEMFVYRG